MAGRRDDAVNGYTYRWTTGVNDNFESLILTRYWLEDGQWLQEVLTHDGWRPFVDWEPISLNEVPKRQVP